MSMNHYSSNQIPAEPHFYWPQYFMDHHSSSPPQKPPTLLSPLIPIKTINFFRRLPSEEEPALDAEQMSGADDGESRNSGGALSLDLKQDHEDREIVPKEHLFEKPLTPSDVGKLNRLVIPKQHAEKYFPLGGGGGSGGDSSEKGLLLTFEDEEGKLWRFRYSYWNSSQSYVLTKGWSRFVKEKRLDAGDFVLFSRHAADSGRLFIGVRRRHAAVDGGRRMFYGPYPNHTSAQGCSSYISHSSFQAEGIRSDLQFIRTMHTASAPAAASGNSKKLRLFGVNLECQADHESEATTPTDGGSPISGHHQYHRWLGPYQQQYYYVAHQHNQVDLNFSGDHRG